MATIATLAIKVQAQIGDLVSNAHAVVSSIDSIAKFAEKTTPKVKDFESSIGGLGIMLDAVEKASVRASDAFGNQDFGQDDIDAALEIYEKTQQTTKAMFDAVVRGAENAAQAISSLPPTIQNAESAMNLLDQAMQARDMDGLAAVGADLSTMDIAIRQLIDSNEILFKRMAVDIENVVPSISNIDEAFGKLTQVREASTSLQMLTGDFTSMQAALAQGERSFDVFATKSAENISKLPPTIESLAESFDFLMEIQAKTKSFEIIPQSSIQSIDVAKQEIEQLGIRIADSITNFSPSMEGIIQAQQEVERLRDMAEQIRFQTGDATALADAILLAEENAAELANQMVQTNIETEMFKSILFSVQNVPFTILSSILKDLYDSIVSIGSEFNERFNGIPGLIVKIVAVLISLIVVIGLAHTKMTTLGASTTYWTGLLQSNMIYQGLVGFSTMLDGTIVKTWLQATATAAATAATWLWAQAQMALNAAMAVNPILAIISIILVVLIAIGAAVYYIYSWFSNSAKAAEEMQIRIKESETRMAEFRDGIQEAAEKYRDLNEAAKKYNDANMSAAEQYEAKIKNIQDVLNKQQVASDAIGKLNLQEIDLVRKIEEAKGNNESDMVESLQKQLDDIRNDRSAIAKEMRNAPELDEVGAASAKEAARLDYLKSLYGDTIEKTVSVQDRYNNIVAQTAADIAAGRMTKEEQDQVLVSEQKKILNSLSSLIPKSASDIYGDNISKLNEALAIGAITQEQFNIGVENAKKIFEKNDEMTQVKKKFADMSKGPLDSFNELATQFRSIKNELAPNEIAVAKKKLLADLANGLGISKYIEDVDTLAGRQRALAETYKNLEQYARKSKMADNELVAAKQKAAKAFLGQSEHGKMLLEAMEAIKPATDRLNEAFAAIDAEAAAAKANGLNITQEAVEKAKAMVEEKIMNKSEGSTSSAKPQNNQALVRGSVAYTDYMNRDGGNDHLKKLRENSKRQIELAEKQIETTRDLGSGLKQCFTVVR